MLFNSIEFLIFLPLVFLLYWYVFRSLRWQNLFVVVVSYLFYGWWDWRFLILIAFTSLCSYWSGMVIGRIRNKGGNPRRERGVLILNLVVNIGLLGYYKYYNFFIASAVAAFQRMGINWDMSSLNIILPVGISFYTFQALSYTIDVYRGKLKVTHELVSFFAFISFFPQLVAGPIERAINLLPQFEHERHFDYVKAVDGMRQILWGFFKKVAVADQCAPLVNDIFAHYETMGGWDLLWGGILFAVQIYGDFSGYSDIAIGVARLFGIELMRNFNFPYFSRDIAEFWRRWHISLTTWFRDYIYIPLGGSRCSKWKVARNTLIIFLVSGLWHGANWTFVVWGAYHALLFFPLLFLGLNRKYIHGVAQGRWYPSVKEVAQMALTFLLVVIGWIIFRADTIAIAWDYLVRMFTEFSFTPSLLNKHVILYIVILMVVEWVQRDKQHALRFDGAIKPAIWRYIIYYAIVVMCLWYGGTQSQFIYFQF